MKKETIIINHPDGKCSLQEIQNDVKAWIKMQGVNSTFGFTPKTVQALIDKIEELNLENKSLKDALYDVPEHC